MITPGKIEKKVDKSADKSTSQQSSSGKIQRSDVPSLEPKKSKPDSDLAKPAAGVSNKAEPPKSEPPKQATLVIPPELKDRIAKDSQKKADANSPVVIPSELKNLDKDTVRKEFEKAFKAARAEKGPGETFTFKDPRTGKEGVFSTNYEKEKKAASAEKAKVTPATNNKSATDNASDNNSEVNPFDTPVNKDVLDKLTKKDSWDTARNAPGSIQIDPGTGNIASDKKDANDNKSLPDITVTSTAVKPNVWRDSSGKPVTSQFGEPWATGTSTKDDIEAAKDELKQQAEIEKDKNKLQAISPDLSKPPESSWKDMWDTGIENLTGKKRMSKDELNTIRVPESINNELADILRLAGRKK